MGYAGLNKIDIERGRAEFRLWVGCGITRKSDAVKWSSAIVEFALTNLNLALVYAFQLGRHRAVGGRVKAAVST